jgi:hypothetical protein
VFLRAAENTQSHTDDISTGHFHDTERFADHDLHIRFGLRSYQRIMLLAFGTFSGGLPAISVTSTLERQHQQER